MNLKNRKGVLGPEVLNSGGSGGAVSPRDGRAEICGVQEAIEPNQTKNKHSAE